MGKIVPDQGPEARPSLEYARRLEGTREADPEETGRLAALAMVALEYERALSMLFGISPDTLSPDTRMAELFPRAGRRDAWNRLQEAMDLKLPRLGAPVWLQHVLGAMLLGGMVLPFWYVWAGLGLFWGTVVLISQIDKLLPALHYPSLGATIRRTVELNPLIAEQFRAHPETVGPLLSEIRQAADGDEEE